MDDFQKFRIFNTMKIFINLLTIPKRNLANPYEEWNKLFVSIIDDNTMMFPFCFLLKNIYFSIHFDII